MLPQLTPSHGRTNPIKWNWDNKMHLSKGEMESLVWDCCRTLVCNLRVITYPGLWWSVIRQWIGQNIHQTLNGEFVRIYLQFRIILMILTTTVKLLTNVSKMRKTYSTWAKNDKKSRQVLNIFMTRSRIIGLKTVLLMKYNDLFCPMMLNGWC